MTQATKQQNENAATHENVIYPCFGGFSNTGLTAGLASLEVVKELGLDKISIGCLSGLSTKIPPVIGKTKAAKKVITVDGCPMECSRKVVEAAGIEITKSIILVRDINMQKKPLSEDIGKNLKPVMQYISNEDIKNAKDLIIKSVLDKNLNSCCCER
jgi:uncharacterized metal-binding protein